ncbi:SDR family NAD(P)-dependent oxidoreductase [Solirubrobacter sp. CPCC 204708]|uniref:SDR family NAD(P)-dependent oxidoreductase n=1 Tax=Solirubrobacter deserti TaxID=2282478 RepID=A0ABT4RL55_9ACTN|nr:SDR family NAD(P)-dependent oxidoreductase [Solirubrobacter deserti]MBE2318981.1 SDR family NAD(P)-dependent oxidoreductase [Solirubrobacter deserti]MDA0139294.1 SDR family NAD(P)-dependent oxidoreductase [Solirubrobacter deserti]
MSQTVLITGCSSGIGRATAEVLAAKGYNVYATARRTESIADLEAKGCKTLALDVTSEDSMVAAVEAVSEGIDALVNNAGIQEVGAIESVPMDRVRALFETNVFGPVRLAQLVLPQMRERRRGHIITVGSMNGKFTWPGTGYYCGTKHALEAISDALRYETRPFGIKTVLIEPGFVKTPLGKTAVGRRVQEDGPYASFNDGVAEVTSSYTTGALGMLACSAEAVGETVLKALSTDKPKARYRVAPSAHMFMATRKVLPDAAFDAMLRSQMPKPGA